MSKYSYLCLKVLILILLISLIGACSVKRDQDDKVIKIGILKHESSLPFYIAAKNNLFKKYGLNVEIKELPPGDHMPALLSDRVDIISPTSFPVLFGIMIQHPKILYSVFPGAETLEGQTVYGIIVGSNSSSSSIRDLIGGTIIAINPYTKINIQMILNSAGILNDDWPEIRVANRESALQAIDNGKANAAILDQPALAKALSTGRYKLIEKNPRAKFIGSPYWSGSGAVKQTVWISRIEEFKKLMNVIDDAVTIIRSDSIGSHKILLEELELEPEIANQCGGYYFPFSYEYVPKGGILNTIDALFSANLISEKLNIDSFFPSGLYGEK